MKAMKAMKKYLDHAHSCKEPCSLDLYSQLQNLKDPFLQNLLLSGIHESLHNNSVDLTEIFKIVGNPKLDHSVLPKHDHKNGGSVVVRKNEDHKNGGSVVVKKNEDHKNGGSVVVRKNEDHKNGGSVVVKKNEDHKNGGSVVVRKNEDVSNLAADSETIPNHDPRTVGQIMRGRRNRVIGGFNVTDIGDDAKAKAKLDKKNEKHEFPWMVRVFGDCGGM